MFKDIIFFINIMIEFKQNILNSSKIKCNNLLYDLYKLVALS